MVAATAPVPGCILASSVPDRTLLNDHVAETLGIGCRRHELPRCTAAEAGESLSGIWLCHHRRRLLLGRGGCVSGDSAGEGD
jgi:hypothetical protein